MVVQLKYDVIDLQNRLSSGMGLQNWISILLIIYVYLIVINVV